MRTRNRLADALLCLLGTRDLADIRAGEVAAAAGVDRQTLYHHFTDIYDLAEFTYDREIARLFGSEDVEETFAVPSDQHATYILRGLGDASTGLKKLLFFSYARNPRGHFYDLVLRNVVQARAELVEAGLTPGRIDLIESMCATTCVSLIMSWLRGGISLTADELAACLLEARPRLAEGFVHALRI